MPQGKGPMAMKSWESLIPAVIGKHYEAVTAYGLGFEGHTWRGQNQQSWRWVHRITRPGQRSLVVAGHDSIFKGEHVQLQQNALWIFDCRQGGSQDPRKAWSPTDFLQIIGRMFSWMSGMPRWNVVLLLPTKYTYEAILPRLALPEGAYAHRAVWFFRDHTQEKGTRVKHGGHMVGSYDPFADVVVISYKPQGTNPAENFVCVDGLYKNRTCFVEPDYAWTAPTCDPLARSPELIEQILESYLPENWALVVQGLSVIVPELQGSRVRRIVVLEANPERESYVKRWASGEMDNTRAVRQTQASMDEEAEEGEPDESGENLGEEDPSEGDEDEGNDGEEEDDADSGNDDDDDTEGSGASGDEDSEGRQNVVDSEADEAEEHKESPSRSNEDGSGGDAREGSDFEVDSPL